MSALGRIAVALKMPIDRSDLNLADVATAELEDGKFGMLIAWARQVGIYVKEVKLDVIEFYGALQESFPLIMASGNGSLWIFEGLSGKNFQATHITDRSQTVGRIRRGELRKMLGTPDTRVFMAKRQLELDAHMGARHHAQQGGGHSHPTPLRRFLALLRLDARDIWTVTLFAAVAGLLALATPLAIESLVTITCRLSHLFRSESDGRLRNAGSG